MPMTLFVLEPIRFYGNEISPDPLSTRLTSVSVVANLSFRPDIPLRALCARTRVITFEQYRNFWAVATSIR